MQVNAPIRRALSTLLFILVCCFTNKAIPIEGYRQNIERAVNALDGISKGGNEYEDPESVEARVHTTLNSVRTLLPLRLNVEWNGTQYIVDNTWLHQLLGDYEKASSVERTNLEERIRQRLVAVDERLAEIEHGSTSHTQNDKAEARRRLQEILARSEYSQKPEEPSALSRLWTRFVRWLASLFGTPKAAEPSTAVAISKGAQVFVVVLALAVIAYVLRLFLPHFRRLRPARKKKKQAPRIVLGERLEPEQTAVDLLSEAEALARKGEMRAAIRKAYIALLVELGDRQIISLAQHKTNRDYLRAMRERASLHKRMLVLTDAFERHWYGLAQATDTDWTNFRARSREVLQE